MKIALQIPTAVENLHAQGGARRYQALDIIQQATYPVGNGEVAKLANLGKNTGEPGFLRRRTQRLANLLVRHVIA